MSIELVMLSNHFILYRPLLLLPSIFPSIRVFCSELALCIRWPTYWSFSNSLSNESSVLISFRIDWVDLLAIQGALKNLLQHHNLKASILLMLSLLYGPTLTCLHDYWENHSFDCMDPTQGWQALKREWIKVWELENKDIFSGPVEFEGSTLGPEPLSIREK